MTRLHIWVEQKRTFTFWTWKVPPLAWQRCDCWWSTGTSSTAVVCRRGGKSPTLIETYCFSQVGFWWQEGYLSSYLNMKVMMWLKLICTVIVSTAWLLRCFHCSLCCVEPVVTLMYWGCAVDTTMCLFVCVRRGLLSTLSVGTVIQFPSI